MSWKLLHCFIVLTTLHYVASLQPLPRVKGSGETITIAAGQTLQLQCIVENMPRKLKAKWERCRRMNEDGVCLSYSGLSSRNKPKFDRYSDLRQDAFNSYILSIYNIRVSQSGTYYCSVKTALLTKRTYDYIHVFVYEVPTIDPLSTTPDTVRMEGAPVQLNCKASGNPTPVVLWRKSGGSTLPGGNPKIRNTTLNLASCDQETKGIYMCVASNKYGTAVHTITLDCLGAPKIEPAPSIMYQKAGYQAKLSCTIFSSPEVTRVWWRKNGEDIPGDSQRTQTMKVYIPVTYSIHSDTLRLTLPSTVRQLLINLADPN
ncbi:hypothetical protein EB796_007348 [Bugula neritina]|uniref:Ig-like domain-containing protein n=1 Tax=Bugula neritina TaxID=10212 RepID=A0A7J7K7Y9_BUGNE|nr:hypothetical protein EB796_007348 [Bugula neritina]